MTPRNPSKSRSSLRQLPFQPPPSPQKIHTTVSTYILNSNLPNSAPIQRKSTSTETPRSTPPGTQTHAPPHKSPSPPLWTNLSHLPQTSTDSNQNSHKKRQKTAHLAPTSTDFNYILLLKKKVDRAGLYGKG